MVSLSQNPIFQQQALSFYKSGMNTHSTPEEAKAFAFNLQDALKLNPNRLSQLASQRTELLNALKKIEKSKKSKHTKGKLNNEDDDSCGIFCGSYNNAEEEPPMNLLG